VVVAASLATSPPSDATLLFLTLFALPRPLLQPFTLAPATLLSPLRPPRTGPATTPAPNRSSREQMRR
jgi:hypothetical protein